MKTLYFSIAIVGTALVALIIGLKKSSTVESPAVSNDRFLSSTEAGRAASFSRSTRGKTAGRDLRTEQIGELASKIEQAIGSEDEAERQAIFSHLLGALVALDPRAASELLKKFEPGPLRDEYLLRLGQLWAKVDSVAAIEWASALEDQGERATVLQSVCLEIAQVDPESAIRTMENLKVPDEKGTLHNLAQLWASKDISAATAWVLAQPEGESRDGLVARIAYVLAQKNPQEAADLVAKSIAPGEVQTEAAISIVHRWALHDWNSAKAWVDLFGDGPLRDRARNELAGIRDYVDALKQPGTGQ